jgi:hypothetical protein
LFKSIMFHPQFYLACSAIDSPLVQKVFDGAVGAFGVGWFILFRGKQVIHNRDTWIWQILMNNGRILGRSTQRTSCSRHLWWYVHNWRERILVKIHWAKLKLFDPKLTGVQCWRSRVQSYYCKTRAKCWVDAERAWFPSQKYWEW